MKQIIFTVRKVNNILRDCKFEFQLFNITFADIDHEILSTTILPLQSNQSIQT